MSLIAAVGMLREAQLVRGPEVIAVAGGARAELLAPRLLAALQGEVRGLISFGLAGALDPALRLGDLVVGAEAIDEDGRRLADLAWTERLKDALPAARLAPVYGAGAMILDPAIKAALRARTGASLVDMESHVAARFAAEHGLPFAILRVVSDTADTALPPAVLHGLKPDGGMNLPGVLLALARRPGQLPALMRTGRDAEQAFAALAAAVRVLGPTLGS